MNFKKISILQIITILILFSCGQNKKEIEQPKANIYGHWLLESLLHYADSAKSILGHKQFFCSEIIITFVNKPLLKKQETFYHYGKEI